MIAKEETRKLTLRQREGRAKNAVAELLRQTLSVPNIYLSLPPSLISADVLAVDRGGAGDLHGVEINLEYDLHLSDGLKRKPTSNKDLKEIYLSRFPQFTEKMKGIHRRLMSMPTHYRYLAIPMESFDMAFGELAEFGLYPEDGIGRLGIILITDKGDEPPYAAMSVVPERFRVDSTRLKAIETKLLAKSRPDIEVRI